MPIYDNSYRHVAETRKAARLRFLPLIGVGLRLFFRKRLHIVMGIAALIPFLIYLVFLNLPTILGENYDPRNLEFFANFLHVLPDGVYLYLTSPPLTPMLFLFTLLAGAGLVANDVRANALEIYFSSPLTVLDYVLGKLSVLLVLLLGITALPLLVLWLVDVLIATEAEFLKAQLPLAPRILAASLVVALPRALLILAISSLVKSARSAMVLFAAIVLVGTGLSKLLPRWLGVPEYGLFSIGSCEDRLVFEILHHGGGPGAELPVDLRSVVDVALTSVDPRWPALVLGAISLVSLTILLRRIRGVEVVRG